MKRRTWRRCRICRLWWIRKEFWFYLSLLSTSSLVYMFSKDVRQLQKPLDNYSLPDSIHIVNEHILDVELNDKNDGKYPLLTLFTTWGPNDNKHQVRNKLLRNWGRLKPYIRPVLFYSKGTNLTSVIENGWDTLQISKSASIGLPILKYMFLDVKAKYKSMFYGYSNGDILFDHGLVETLLAVANASLIPYKPVMVIGRRTNVPVQDIPGDIGFDHLSELPQTKGDLFVTKAEDYFITDQSYPWKDIPEFVIGRVAFDNWLVHDSCKRKYNVIEATPTLLAVHVTTKAGNFEGIHKWKPYYNKALLLKRHEKLQFVTGSTSCAPWLTKYLNDSFTKQMTFLWRKVPEYCHQY